MKRITAVVILVFLLVGCGSKYSLHEDFETDLNQILKIIDSAREEKRDLETAERDIVRDFEDKYEVGQFVDSNKNVYEMNDLEKVITNEISTLRLFIGEEEKLASEKGLFESTREKVKEYIETKEIPDDLIGTLPTYEIYYGVHPAIKEDVEKIINEFDYTVSGKVDSFTAWQKELVNNFIEKYEKMEFEIEGKKYKVNSDGFTVYAMVLNLKEDLEEEKINSWTKYSFEEVKEMIDWN